MIDINQFYNSTNQSGKTMIEDTIANLYTVGKSLEQIAEILEVPRTFIYNIIANL